MLFWGSWGSATFSSPVGFVVFYVTAGVSGVLSGKDKGQHMQSPHVRLREWLQGRAIACFLRLLSHILYLFMSSSICISQAQQS